MLVLYAERVEELILPIKNKIMTSPLLSRDEAMDFIHERLHIRDDVIRPSIDLVERIIVAFQQNLPFQSLTNMAVLPQDRHVPSPEQVKQDMFLGHGGRFRSVNRSCMVFIARQHTAADARY